MTIRLKEALTRRGISQVELAERIDVSPGYISEIKTGKKIPSLDILRRISEVLDVSLADLYPASGTPAAPGFGESTLEPVDLGPPASLRAVARAAGVEERPHLAAYRLTRACPGFALLENDIVLVDTQSPGTEGALVVLTEMDETNAHGTTTVRRLMSPWLMPENPQDKPLRRLSNSQSQALLGTVVGVLRKMQAGAP